jgi:predicted DNA-binding transcriptional regulator AlpA
MSEMLTTDAAAQVLGVAPATLDAWRCYRRSGPPFVRLGRAVRYRRADLEQYIHGRTVRAEPIERDDAPSVK